MMEELKVEIGRRLNELRSSSPLVHNITNYVVMNNTANALLAVGASPVMAHSLCEVEQMAGIASSLVINIGTLSPEWVTAMELAMRTAAGRGIPIVFDPVGAGATGYRNDVCSRLLGAAAPSVIRGNASEITALVDSDAKTRGVDSNLDGAGAEGAARTLALRYGCTVSVSGPTDLITDGERSVRVLNGHRMLPKVTGLGCTATAVTGAFAAVCPDAFGAALAAMSVMGVCGEAAAERSAGPGSLQLNILDEFYRLDGEVLSERLRLG